MAAAEKDLTRDDSLALALDRKENDQLQHLLEDTLYVSTTYIFTDSKTHLYIQSGKRNVGKGEQNV